MTASPIGVCVPNEDYMIAHACVRVLVSSEDLTLSLTFIRVPISGDDSLSHQSTLVLYFNSPLHHDAFKKAAIKGRIMSRT